MAYGAFPDLAALARAIAGDLCEGSNAVVTADPAIVAQAVERGIRENFRLEEQIERDAEKALAELGPSTVGMDRTKLLAGIRERLAKQRGFVL